MLMLTVTVAAVGGAIWWRWPVIVTTSYGNSVTQQTYHRGLWGNLIRHGAHRTTVQGKVERERQYREGELVSCKYHTGALVLAYEYKNGKLNSAPHRPRGSPVLRRMSDAFVNNPNLEDRLQSPADLDYIETPLQEVLVDLHERFALPLSMMSKRKEIFDAPITLNVKGWPIEVGFDAMLSPLGLVLDSRYGALCVVDADGAASWQDSTGVMDLGPPDSSFAKRLDMPAKATSAEPLVDALLNLAAYEIPVEFRSEKDQALLAGGIPQRKVLMIHTSPDTMPGQLQPITVRQLLGLQLDQAELHCHEEKGVLIIEPYGTKVADAKVVRP